MADPGFDAEVERVRLTASHKLPPSCVDDFQRLSRTLVYGPVFQWLLVDAPDEHLRQQIMAALDKVLRAAGMRSNRLPLSNKITDVVVLESRLLKNAGQAEVVHVIGRPGWFNAARWDAFNVRRERLAIESRARLVFWLDAEAIALASRGAPDLWAWRGGIYSFLPGGISIHLPMPVLTATGSVGSLPSFAIQVNNPDNRSREERLQRIADIRNWLDAMPPPPDEVLGAPVEELGRLLFSLGDFDAALKHWKTVALPLYERLGEVYAKAATQGKIADIFRAMGQLDQALRIYREEELPVYERLGEMHAKAATLGKMADILQSRGEQDEALRILREQVLPVFDRLGDLHARAVTLSKIAENLLARGQPIDALQTLREEVLPVFNRLENLREKAVTLAKISDILQERGQLDEALYTLRSEVLPAFERLGNVQDKAVTLGKIGFILEARGQLGEALALHKQRLRLVEQAGFPEDIAQVHFSLARVQMARGDHQPGDLKSIRDNLEAAFATSLITGNAAALANIGILLAKALVQDQQIARALEVLGRVEPAFQALGNQTGIEQVGALKQQIAVLMPPSSL